MATTETKQNFATDLEAFRTYAAEWLEANAPKRGDVEARDQSETADHGVQMGSSAERDRIKRSKEFQKKLYDAGLAGIAIPKEDGGQGLTREHEAIYRQEASKYTLPTAPFGLGLGLGLPTILAHGTPEQKQRYVAPLLAGEEIWCQLFSEPGAGSDLAGLQAKAERTGDEWIINGQKVWTSGAHYSDFGYGVFRSDPDLPKHQGLTYFLVDLRSPGVTVRPLRQITGEAQFNEIFFDDVRVPDFDRLGDINDGWRVALTTLMYERMMIGGGGAPAQQRRRGRNEGGLLKLARDVGVLDDPDIRDHVIDLYVQQRILRLLGQRMVVEAAGKAPGPEFSMMKLMGARLGAQTTELAVNLPGPAGIAWESRDSIGRRWSQSLLASRSGKIAGGTDEVMLNILGERVLGLPQDPRPDKELPFREVKVGRITS
jgi:acyl-CoA dehydrogenase